MNDDDAMPSLGEYRGISLDKFQSRDRVNTIVVPAIDHVLTLRSPAALARYAADVSHPPEARLAAGRRVLALVGDAAERHRAVAGVDTVRVQASIAGLGSLRWADPTRYASLFEPDPPASHSGPRAAARPPAFKVELRAARAAWRAGSSSQRRTPTL